MSDELRIFGGSSSEGVKSDFSSSSSVSKHSVVGRKLKKKWIIVGIILFFTVPGILFLLVPAVIIYSIWKANDPSKPYVLDFLFEKESRVGMYNRMMKEGTGSAGERHFAVVNQADAVRGSGFEGSGLLKKLFGVGLGLFGLAVLGIFGLYVFVEYSSGFSSVPFLSGVSSVVSAGLLVVGLLFAWFFIKIFSRRDERL